MWSAADVSNELRASNRIRESAVGNEEVIVLVEARLLIRAVDAGLPPVIEVFAL